MDHDIDKRKENAIVHTLPLLDLDAYINNYTGRTKIQRLLFIANRCPPLAAQALQFGIKLLQSETFDVKAYQQACNHLLSADPPTAEALGHPDQTWIDATTRRAKVQGDKLENELKSYRNNLIKESIRMGHGEIGNHWFKCGEFEDAFKAYSRMRDFCTTPQQVMDMSMDIITVAAMMDNFMLVGTYAERISNASGAEKEELQFKIRVTNGLVLLADAKYKAAAEVFVDVTSALGSSFSDIIVPNDVAVYGGLCALATFDRADLKSKAIENSDFKPLLEFEPQIRRAMEAFYASDYATCLRILQEHRTDYLLDIYLAPHVKPLYALIRERCIAQYFSPYTCVSLAKMASAFAMEAAAVEREMVMLIERGKLTARIDTQRGLVVAKRTDQRGDVYRKTLHTAQEYNRAARVMLARMNLIQAGLEIPAQKREHGREAMALDG